ncbi:hypothetical protein SLS56_008846 [Neofusicoccum ribis]|uniref:RelA/SpoT domain-containing protein n=1 Tax=Neofusicoccum ribis TaxID=45134 RepID=A0ABR3SIX1_9PEZI
MGQSDLIKEFLANYKRKDKAHYERIATEAKTTCETRLRSSAIQAQVTCRAKELGSLRKKVLERNALIPGGYKNVKEIEKDIVDLAGVRIALYFPNQGTAVEKIIAEAFKVHKEIQHSGEDREPGIVDSENFANNQEDNGEGRAYFAHFSGYKAKHYRVSPLAEEETDEDMDMGDNPDIIEIQVISMLRHTWAQVGHDLVYKQMSGSPSNEEERILDGLSGLIQVGEVLLEQLHDVYQIRSNSQNIKFANQYELGSFLAARKLQQSLGPTLAARKLQPAMNIGSLETLLDFLAITGHDNPKALNSALEALNKASSFDEDYMLYLKQNQPLSKPSLAVLIMETILSRVDELSLRRPREEINDEQSRKEKCKIMVSTIALLDELFPPFRIWTKKIFSDRSNIEKRRDCFEWLKSMKDTQDIVGEEEKRPSHLFPSSDAPWDWFTAQSNGIIDFAFRVCRLGVLRGLPRFSQLKVALMLESPSDWIEVPDRRRHVVARKTQSARSSGEKRSSKAGSNK